MRDTNFNEAKEKRVKKYSILLLASVFMVTLVSGISYASDEEKYSSTINVFKQSPQVEPYFKNAYGYAVFPTIGKGGLGIGGAHGKGQVYRGG